MTASSFIFGFGRDMVLAGFVLSALLNFLVAAKGARLGVAIGLLLPAAYLALGAGPALWGSRPAAAIILYLAGVLFAMIASLGGAAVGMALRRRFRSSA